MPTVADILSRKGAEVFTIPQDATVLAAAELMNRHKVGAVVVCADARVLGMFTERDVLRRVVGERRDPATTRIRDVMTTEISVCRRDTDLDEARSAMKHRRIRHLPVIDQAGQLLGLISIGDLNAFDADTQETTIYLLHEYIYGRV